MNIPNFEDDILTVIVKEGKIYRPTAQLILIAPYEV
jgi:hypothetical protein